MMNFYATVSPHAKTQFMHWHDGAFTTALYRSDGQLLPNSEMAMNVSNSADCLHFQTKYVADYFGFLVS